MQLCFSCCFFLNNMVNIHHIFAHIIRSGQELNMNRAFFRVLGVVILVGFTVPVQELCLAAATVGPRQLETRLNPGEPVRDHGSAVQSNQGAYHYLEIEVSHSAHTMKLRGVRPSSDGDILYQCRVGLGSPVFPTPVGVYFVTHIYDENPWWIPPPNRAWAAGHSPSRRVYGGTMAPLLKKRMVPSKKKETDHEDFIEGRVSLEDYGYRFHGTDAPRSIGHNQSHGCVRMLPKDAGAVATLIKEHVGISERKESENGTFVVLRSPVRLNLVR